MTRKSFFTVAIGALLVGLLGVAAPEPSTTTQEALYIDPGCGLCVRGF